MNPPLQAWMQVTGWTLIHFVWQGALLAVATAAGLRLARRRSSQARYAIACIGLAAMLVSPIVTAAIVRGGEPNSSARDAIQPAGPGSDLGVTPRPTATAERVPMSSGAAGVAKGLGPWLPAVVWAWLAGVALLLARFAGGWWRVRGVRIASLAADVSPWQAVAERLAAGLRVNAVFRVVESSLVEAPAVIGSLRPVILLPVAVLTNLTPLQIESLLAHELAHIRRRDYAVNLLQTAAETLLFYHPAVWWASARVREEREHCCDDVAVDACGEPAAYAAALAELAFWRSGGVALSVGAADGPLLARIRRLLRAPEDDHERPAAGLAVLAAGMLIAAGVAVQSTAGTASAPSSAASVQTGGIKTLNLAGTWLTRTTDHFEIYYPADLDLHADRVAHDAERAYEHVSGDLRHNLAFKVPVVLMHTAADLERSAQLPAGQMRTASFAEPSRDRILLATDRPADQWYGLLAHEVAHVFGFDIIPGAATPAWIAEGLAEYERAAWDPSDLVVLREAVRADAIPKLSRLAGERGSADARLADSVGHAAFDFIESRWGKAGIRQFIFQLRQAAGNGGDPYQSAFAIGRDEFDQAFDSYLKNRFAVLASPAARFDSGASLRIEGEVTAISLAEPRGRACLELWALVEGARQRWAVECGAGTEQDVLKALKPGDRIAVTGAPVRAPERQRVFMTSVERASDGLTWRGSPQ